MIQLLVLSTIMLTLLACSGSPSAPPSPTPDAPRFSLREAVAVLETALSNGGDSCRSVLRVWGGKFENLTEYLGKGEWKASNGGGFDFRVFEQSQTVSGRIVNSTCRLPAQW